LLALRFIILCAGGSGGVLHNSILHHQFISRGTKARGLDDEAKA
jgi:hypothetical protein